MLRGLGKSVQILNSDPCPAKLQVFDPDGEVKSLDEGATPPTDLADRVAILVDTSDFQHTRRAEAELLARARKVLIIDHHTAPRVLPAPAYIDDTAAASSQIVWNLAQALGVSVPLSAANALFMGIVFDTGSFIYPKTSPATFQAAEGLVRLGVSPKEIHSALWETIEPGRMRLLALVQGTLRLAHRDRTAVQIVTQKMLRTTGTQIEEAETFINYPLKCATVTVSLVIKEIRPGVFRCSLRSKGGVDVSRLALAHGGGGHKTAAGFPLPDLPLAQLKALLLKWILDLHPKD